MDKQLIQCRIQTIKNNYALAQAGIALFTLPDARERLAEVYSLLKHHPETERIRYIDYIFEDYELLQSATNEFRNAALRGCIRELFEQIKHFGSDTVPKDLREPCNSCRFRTNSHYIPNDEGNTGRVVVWHKD